GIRTVDHIVVQNRHQLETCRKNYGREATLIPSCYELPEESIYLNENCEKARKAISVEQNLILWCGTVHKYKQPEILLDLARRLPHRKFAMVGGPGIDETAAAPYYP